MSRESSKLLKATESQRGDFAYSSLRVMKGSLLADLVDQGKEDTLVLGGGRQFGFYEDGRFKIL